MMWNNSYNMIKLGFGGWILVLIFIIILINAGVIIFFTLRNRGNFTDSSKNENPHVVLKNRYTKGEITKKEFDEMEKEI